MIDAARVVKDLGREKSLWAIVLASRCITPSIANLSAPILFGGAVVAFFFYLGGELSQILALARDVSRIALNSAVALTGFYLSGFAIFATLGEKALFVAMARMTNEKFGLSYFKYNFFVLLRALVIAIGISFLLLVCILCLGPGSGLGALLIDKHPMIVRLLGCGVLGFASASVLVLIITTGAFVANVYVTVVTSIQWEVVKQPSNANPCGKSHDL